MTPRLTLETRPPARASFFLSITCLQNAPGRVIFGFSFCCYSLGLVLQFGRHKQTCARKNHKTLSLSSLLLAVLLLLHRRRDAVWVARRVIHVPQLPRGGRH